MTPDDGSLAFPSDVWRGLFRQARAVTLIRNRTLFVAGDPGDGCYQVVEGLLKVTAVLPSDRQRILAILGPGSLVGELSMIDGAVRSATITAIKDSKLRFVSRAVFESFSR